GGGGGGRQGDRDRQERSPLARPADAPDTAERRLAEKRLVEEFRSTRLALGLDDLIPPAGTAEEDETDVGRARKAVHRRGIRFVHRAVRRTGSVLERRRGIRSVDVPKRGPVVASAVRRILRFPPRLEREPGTIAAR